jgi:hypothetical protein
MFHVSNLRYFLSVCREHLQARHQGEVGEEIQHVDISSYNCNEESIKILS